jgi:hypothetical protein
MAHQILTPAKSADIHRTPFPSQDPNTLISDVVQAAGSRTATLTLNRDDRFFFDHPLDHVPAMALVSGLLALARSSGADEFGRAGLSLRLSLALPAFCELGAMVQLTTTAPVTTSARAQGGGGQEPASQVSMQACQEGVAVCDGDLEVHPVPPISAGAARLDTGHLPQPVEKALVHRRRPENILIQDLVTDGQGCTVTVLPPPAGHLLATGPGQPMRPEVLIEAARQFGTLICHAEHDVPLDASFILLRIDGDIPCGLRRRVQLRWRRTPAPRGRRAAMELEIIVGDPDGEPCGRVAFDYFAASPALYQRLRSRKASA